MQMAAHVQASQSLESNVALQQILFPVDFSEHCTAVADYVEAMAQGSGARLTLLHVLELPPSWYSDIEGARLAALVDVPLASISTLPL